MGVRRIEQISVARKVKLSVGGGRVCQTFFSVGKFVQNCFRILKDWSNLLCEWAVNDQLFCGNRIGETFCWQI